MRGTFPGTCDGSSRARWAALSVLLVAASLVASGCSSTTAQGQGATTRDDTPSTPSSTASDGESATPTDSGAGSLDVGFTSPDGWTYAATLPLPTATVFAAKDISSSPPGFAKLEMQLQTTPSTIQEQTLADTNEGRPDGPELSLGAGTFVFPVGDDLVDRIDDSMLEHSGDASIGNPQIGPCSLYPPYGSGYAWWPSASGAVFCSAGSDSGGSDSGRSDYSADEALVDQLVSALQGVKSIYVVNWEQNGASSCNVAILPTGQVQFAPDYASSCPSKLTLTATPGSS